MFVAVLFLFLIPVVYNKIIQYFLAGADLLDFISLLPLVNLVDKESTILNADTRGHSQLLEI